MALSRCFTLIGDSNIRNHINKTSIRASPSIKAAQILTCGSVQIFKETLDKVRDESNVCILACLTNFLTGSGPEGPDSISQRINPVLQDLRETLLEVCDSLPDRQFLLSPPMYRTSPVWYREGLPEVLTTFSQIFSQERPSNLHLLSSFATPSFEKDGIHLTSYSGLEFLLHLFDGSQELLDGLSSPPDAVAAKTSEGTRVLEDRMMALEQDHRRLNRVFEDKVALDAEAADYRENAANQDCFVVVGLPLIPSEIVGKEWQELATKHVSEFLKILMGRVANIVFIKNSTARHKGAEVTYTVKMREVSESKAIRDKFGGYFVGNIDKRPKNLKKYSVRNFVTPETKVRIAVLQVIAKRYRASNAGAKVQVVGYEPRPRMKITPAAGASDRRVQVHYYVQAVKKFPTNFSSSDQEFIFKKINPKWSGSLRSLFICISDDVYRESRKQFERNQAAEAAEASEDGETAMVTDGAQEAEAEAEANVRPPPTSAPTSSSGRGRSQKRGASSPADSGNPKK